MLASFQGASVCATECTCQLPFPASIVNTYARNARLIEQPDPFTDSLPSHPGGQDWLATFRSRLPNGFGGPRRIGHSA